MNAHTHPEAAYLLAWNATYIRRATAVADALAHFVADGGGTTQSENSDIVAGGITFLSSYLGMIATEAESSAEAFKGKAQ
ncbi:hypothetical protein ACI01nite_11910 [Acetobacter cibinongensis]|uniref:Uncharacterized protein n=1 Tax=Acetobacter cibinongensis TaxID=146475 RepID=A0A0D6N4N7_9PROT|nr:hypothetical protein [Acetobacter cibinongensis]GAN60914.1 hypothetical protein Abci_017_098 [Acetobacter cibinongensis]GBQ13271.1 hypothetical protein AA0482_0535 [Acetobacter cibinongensis NRIC 0482]GEL58589.1 hypothetical protein ACI01nite_11910 [Acetobacter cibinongensis]